MKNVLDFSSREAFRLWLFIHSEKESECWLEVRRGRPDDSPCLWYIDAVEEALCFGWIDSVFKFVDGRGLQRFSPRKKRSPWTELNKERVRRLEKLNLMTDKGKRVLPAMGPRSFKVDPDVEKALKAARVWTRFRGFHPLYQRVRAYNVAFYKRRDPKAYRIALEHLIADTKNNKMLGNWNDYGRLLDY